MSNGIGPWTTAVFFPNFLSNDPSTVSTQTQSGVTFTASASGDSLAVGNIDVGFGSCGSKRRAWAWSPDGNYFAYVSSANGPDWNLTIVALQDLRRADCSLLKRGSFAATASGVFAGQSNSQWWTTANFGWLGSKAVIANGAYAGGSGSVRTLVCPEAPGSRVWSDLVPDYSGKIDWVFLSSPSGNAVTFAPKKLNASAPQIEFILVSTATARAGQFAKNGVARSIIATGPSPSITTNQHAINGVRIDTGDGTTIDVDDPDCTSGVAICKVQPFSFPPVVLDGPEDRTITVTGKIRNDAKDIGCLEIKGIGNAGPFKVVTPSQYPKFIAPGGNSPLSISFSPTQEKPYAEDLPISADSVAPSSDSVVHCTGSARKSNAQCKISGGTFPEVVIGANTTAVGTFFITNDGGGDKLKVDSVSNDAPFSVTNPVPNYSRLLSKGDRMAVTVEFKPDAVGTVTRDLNVVCTPPNGDTKIRCTATARMPRIGLTAAAPESFATYCNHRKRVSITLRNTGEVPLAIDVTGTPENSFQRPPPPPIPANTQQAFDLFVWCGSPGPFTVTLTIQGSFQAKVDDKVISDTTSCTVAINGTVSPMPADAIEPNDNFATATHVDLPMPRVWDPVSVSSTNLNLADNNCAGTDKDCFALSFQCSSKDDTCTSDYPSTTRIGMGVLVNYYPPILSIRTVLKPVTQEDGRPFTTSQKIFKSDTYNQSLFAETTAGSFVIPCPSRRFPDKKLYIVLSNPDFFSQGPVEYDIFFTYEPSKVVCSGGVFTNVEFQKLHRYYEKIWLGNPPRDLAGKIVNERSWLRGARVVVTDLKTFIEKHLAFVSQPAVLSDLQKTLKQRPGAILAQEKLVLAQIARTAGLFREAEYLYEESVTGFARSGLAARQADALQGLRHLYSENHLVAESARIEKALEKLLK